MKKNYIIVAVCILLAVLIYGGFTLKGDKAGQNNSNEQEIVDNSTVIEDKNTSSTPTEPKPVSPEISTPIVDQLWKIFSQYLEFAKNQDRDNLKTVSYQLSQSCTPTPVTDECKSKMSAVYEAGKYITRNDFAEVWSDQKQAIVLSEAKKMEDSQSVGYQKSILVFAKNSQGQYGLLALDPQRSWLAKKSATTTNESLYKTVSDSMIDTDKDGVTDDFEKCIFPDSILVISECIKTDPAKRDTNGDGWWDGVGMYIDSFKKQ
jgi:hypothetical protein